MAARSTLFPILAIAGLALALFACDDGQAPDTGPRTLTVTLDGNGRGTVTSSPAGIICTHEDASCTAEFELGTEVTLSVEAGLRTEFAGWSGPCTGADDCVFNLNDDATVTAALDNPQLVEAVIGADGGSITSPDSALTLTFPAGALASDTTITLEQVTAEELDEDWGGLLGSDSASYYQAGPEGLEFAQPVHVTYRSGRAAEDTDTSSVIAPEFLLTASDTIEALTDMTMTVDAGGEIIAEGLISHFSPVVWTLDREDVAWVIAPKPGTEVPVGVTEWVGEEIFWNLSPYGVATAAEYSVTANAPVSLVSPATGEYTEQERSPGTFGAAHEIECQNAGDGGSVELEAVVYVTDATYEMQAVLPISCFKPPPVLFVDIHGTGTGSVESSPEGVSCPGDCEAEFAPGTEITLLATSSVDQFTGWNFDSEACPNSEDPSITFTIGTDPVHCRAHFINSALPALYVAGAALMAGTSDLAANSHASTVVEGADEIDTAAEAEAGAMIAGSTAGTAGTAAAEETVRHVASVDAASGDFYLWRWTDPTAPELIYSVSGLCPGAHHLLYDATGRGGSPPYFEALSLPQQSSCYVEVEPGGFVWSTVYNFTSWGERALVPDSELEALAIFQYGKFNVHDPTTNTTRTLSISGSERSCPYSVEATETRAFVVGREGEVGTTTENCNNWRKLFVVDLAGAPSGITLEGSVDVGDMPRDVAVTADGSTAYVADFANDEVHVIDAATQTITRTLNVGDGPTGMALTPDGAHLLVANWNAGTVQVIDLATDEIIIDHETGYTQPVKIDLTADGTGVIVTHWGGDSEDASVIYYELYIP